MKKNYMLFFTDSKNRIYRHLVFLFFMFIMLYFRDVNYNLYAEFVIKILIFCIILFLFYANMYWLVPKYLLQNKFITYCIIVIISILILYLGIVYLITFLRPYHQIYKPKKNDNELSFLFSVFMMLVLIAASAGVKLFQRWLSDTQLINELEKSKITAEIEQLKNQINPHFLFNMLNNANVLTKKDPDKASQVLIKLSDLLRYQLYDSIREHVLLTADIHFLEDFLNLEKVRRDSFDFVISKEGDLSGVQIPPLLFISFVENAVKHNNDVEKSSYVNLFFDVRKNELFFKCINSKPIIQVQQTNIGGLGLTNIKRRLELLFPLSHTLKIEDNLETYSVTLTIKL